MRVVLITASPSDIHCGIGDYSSTLADALTQLGDDVTLVRGKSHVGSQPAPLSSVDIRPVVSDWSLASLAFIGRVVLQPAPDVVHIQFPGRSYGRSFTPNVLPWLLRVRTSASVVTTLHEYGIAGWRGRLRILLGALGSHAIVCPDDVIAEQIQRALHRLGKRRAVHVIPAASSIPAAAATLDTRAVLRRWAVPEASVAVAWFGLLTREKGGDTLIRSLTRVRAHKAITLVMVGDLGQQTDASELLADLHALQVPLVVTGPISAREASELLASVDVVALPFARGVTSRRTSYLAAREQGAYVVTTHPRKRGYDADSNTRFIAPNDADALASAILDSRERQPIDPTTPWRAIAESHSKLYRSLRAVYS